MSYFSNLDLANAETRTVDDDYLDRSDYQSRLMRHTAPQARDFSATTRAALLFRGIRIVGVQAVPAFDGDVYFSGTAYQLDDNGTHRLRSYREVEAMSKEAIG